MIEGFFAALDTIFLPIISLPPLISLVIFAIILTLLITLLGKIFGARNVQSEIVKKIEDIREKITIAQKNGDKEMTEKLVKELMKINNEYIKQSFKLLLISIVIISIFVPWFNFKYQGLSVAALPFSLPFLGQKLTWLYWYFFASLVASWLIKKFLG